MNLSVPDYILSIKQYVAGKPLEELEREYGIKNSIKLASNENPLGPSPLAVQAIQKEMTKLHRYPDANGYYLRNKLSEKLKVPSENIVLGNGSDDIISMLTRALLCPGDEAIIPRPSFLMYDISVRSVGALPVYVPLCVSSEAISIDLDAIKKKISSKTRMIFLTNPNNPTGTIFTRDEFEKFLENIPPEILIVLDEAYIEFVRDQRCLNSLDFLDSGRALVTLRTFSKAYGLAGLRIGYGVMPEEIADLLNRIRQPFNANSLAQAGAIAALDDENFLKKTITLVHEGLDYFYDALDRIKIKYFETQANFLLIDIKRDADKVFKHMLKEGVIVRSMTSYEFPEYIRINAGLKDENVRFINVFEKVLGL